MKKIFIVSFMVVTAVIVFTMGFLSFRASANSDCEPELCLPSETLTEFNYNSKPQSTYIDENIQNVADQLCQSSGYLSVDTTDGDPHYIYMNWDDLGDISIYKDIVSFDLLLNHKEVDSTITVELKDESSNWIQVCDPAERSLFGQDTCDLSPYFDTLKQVSPIELRIIALRTDSCHEYLKCAKLNVELYNCEPPACIPEGGSGAVVPGGPSCCAGLTQIGCGGPNQSGNCSECVGAFYCTMCGDGICGLGENKCNCPQDCSECQSNADCDDQNACTTDSCDTGAGQCVHADITCFDQNPCTDDSCNPTSGCVFTPNQQCVCDPNQELVNNGGFESPIVIDGAGWDIFNNAAMNSWTAEWMSLANWGDIIRPITAFLELQRGVAGDAHTGNQLAELDSDWFGPNNSTSGEPASVKIYQDIPTISGENYDISFWFSPRPNTASENNSVEFSWNGEIKDTITNGAGENNTTWKEYKYSFQATGNTTRIQFADLGVPSDSLGTYLDDVSVKCNPSIQSCGNNVIEQGETCELPNTTDNQNCQQSTTQCADGNKTQTRDAFGNCDALCGCVLDAFSAPTCIKNSCNATCAVDADCDDQNENTTDTCNLTTCSCENVSHTCGNGIIQTPEQCDDGTQNGQVCSPACNNNCAYCSAQCMLITVQGEACGVGGNGGGGGGGGGGHLVVCGDNIREWEEQCDDGNTIDGDGCSSTCKTETEQQGEVLGEATTRLPETGVNPFWMMFGGLAIASLSFIGIIILIRSIKNEKRPKKNSLGRADNGFCYCFGGCGLPVLAGYRVLFFAQT